MNTIIVWCEMFGNVCCNNRNEASAFIKRNNIKKYVIRTINGKVLEAI